MGHINYKNVTANNFNKEWANSVTLAEFKKNSIVKHLNPSLQTKLYNELTAKKQKAKSSEN